jgi:hypothetical protein
MRPMADRRYWLSATLRDAARRCQYQKALDQFRELRFARFKIRKSFPDRVPENSKAEVKSDTGGSPVGPMADTSGAESKGSTPFAFGKHVWAFGLSAAAVLSLLLFNWLRPVPHISGPLRQDAYVWQRSWTEPVREAVAGLATNFSALAVLCGEVTWRKGAPEVVRVTLDYAALRQVGPRVGLALRIGAFAGPFVAGDERTQWLGNLAASFVQEAVTNQLQIAELQIDFDCAESKLEGYRVWVEAIHRQVVPVPVTITALPAWLKRPAFKALIAAADGYVLQVHSLERPRSSNAFFTLCDPEAARGAVVEAARLGKPFRVALPTYGYLLAFDSRGRFAGLTAEAPAKAWPGDFQTREVRADPQAMAALIQSWKSTRPQALQGVIWYRLPVSGENLNWRWPTLSVVMAGKTPRASVQVETRQPQPGLVEVELINTGQAAFNAPLRVTLSWREARLVAADGLQEIEVAETNPLAVQFTGQRDRLRLEPGDRRTIGWLRLSQPVEVTVEVHFDDKQF